MKTNNILIIVFVIVALVLGIAVYFSTSNPQTGTVEEPTMTPGETGQPFTPEEGAVEEKELSPILLDEAEQEILLEEGLTLPSTSDEKTDKLLDFSDSDEIEDIEKDLNETDLSGLDDELLEIDNILEDL